MELQGVEVCQVLTMWKIKREDYRKENRDAFTERDPKRKQSSRDDE